MYIYVYIYINLCFYDQRTGNIPNCNLPIAQTSHRDFGVGTIPKVTTMTWYFSIWLGQSGWEYIDVAKNMLFLNACTLLFDNSMSE
jgi:hypothetical protein